MDDGEKRRRCQFWLKSKRRFCANNPLSHSPFCGNHNSDGLRVPCPVDPSHSVLEDNLDSHIKRCPARKQSQELESQPYYSKGINAGDAEDDVSSEAKRASVYGLTLKEFQDLVSRIREIHSVVCGSLPDSQLMPDVCRRWLNQISDRQLPYQEKHTVQQASILGNMEAFGIFRKLVACSQEEGRGSPAAVEFGAGRGYLTQMLADCYGIEKIFLVERRSYKNKADRSLRQNQNINLERLRIDIEDLNLNAIGSLVGLPYIAVGKHLCGPAIDLTIRCCVSEQHNRSLLSHGSYLQGLGLATCCHHLCQWKHYVNKSFFLNMGISRKDFHAITWFCSWAVDADHGLVLADVFSEGAKFNNVAELRESELGSNGAEEAIKNMSALDRAVLGFMCKEVIDTGRLLWLKEHGLDAQLVKYVPSSITPENHLIVARYRSCP